MEITLGLKLKQLRADRGWTQNELAKRSGVERGYLAHLELDKVAKPSADIFLKLARAFRIHPDELYQAAGYIKDDRTIRPIKETPEELLDRLKLATPVSIPVYTEFPFHAGDLTEPMEYIYRAATRPTRRGIEGYLVHGTCLEPKVRDGDIIVVDREATIDTGDIVAGLFEDGLRLGQLKKIADELWLETNKDRIKLEECQVAAVIIEVIRRLK